MIFSLFQTTKFRKLFSILIHLNDNNLFIYLHLLFNTIYDYISFSKIDIYYLILIKTQDALKKLNQFSSIPI